MGREALRAIFTRVSPIWVAVALLYVLAAAIRHPMRLPHSRKPEAGGVFAVEVSAAGLPEPEFIG